MPAPSDFHFYEDTFSKLNVALTTYVGDVSANVIGAVSGVAYSMLIIYVMLWGWTMLRGMISEPITDGIARIVRLAVIVGIALNTGRYSTYISDFLWNTPEAMAGIVASGYSDPDTNVQYLDGLMSKLYDLGNGYYENAFASGGMIPDLGLLAAAFLIWVAAVAATAYAAFLLALSKMALAILLGIGPIFVLLLIFDGTKRFFEAWLGQALNYVFLVILTAGAIKLIMTIIVQYLNVAAGGSPAALTVELAVPAVVMCLIAALVMMQLPSIASALGGGAAISTLGAAGWTYGKATTAVSALRPTSLRRSLNRAASDVRVVGGGAKAVGRVPMSVYRKITGGRKNTVKAIGS
ncbi:type IV secretion system protein [Massilia sp. H6]|uniref:type IV secretion system protein n=1 Tax=Massilia sp. H6 TaxID=2970464 RepID=UPI002169F6C8|nr:type IV secretion system protein [Massilia sp. H6]UVW30685.1 type IV secretion system protein [Massilia sp. H6]